MRHGMLAGVLVAVLVVVVAGCKCPGERGQKKETPAQAVMLSDVPAPARAQIEKLTAGGTIKKIEKAEEGGRTIYDVEATVGDKAVEYDIAADGAVLTSEQSVPYASVPAVVRTAVEKSFGSAQVLQASEEIEGTKTFYEVSGRKAGVLVTLKLTDTGQIVEEEKE
jgi:uncharacterized membrane protein YkoI